LYYIRRYKNVYYYYYYNICINKCVSKYAITPIETWLVHSSLSKRKA